MVSAIHLYTGPSVYEENPEWDQVLAAGWLVMISNLSIIVTLDIFNIFQII